MYTCKRSLTHHPSSQGWAPRCPSHCVFCVCIVLVWCIRSGFSFFSSFATSVLYTHVFSEDNVFCTCRYVVLCEEKRREKEERQRGEEEMRRKEEEARRQEEERKENVTKNINVESLEGTGEGAYSCVYNVLVLPLFSSSKTTLATCTCTMYMYVVYYIHVHVYTCTCVYDGCLQPS